MDRCNIFQSLTLNSTGLVSEQFQRLELSLLEETFPPFSDAKIDTCYTETSTFPRIFPQVQHLLWVRSLTNQIVIQLTVWGSDKV